MESYADTEDANNQDIFTEKQCRVLDLLVEHKTSKEIARELGISPYTVDQRISLARAKLGVASRSELAARYQAMRKPGGRSPAAMVVCSEEEQTDPASDNGVFRSLSAGESANSWQATPLDEAAAASSLAATSDLPCPTVDEVDYRVGPEVFEGPSAGWWRLGAIVATALVLVMTILGLFAIFDQLSAMLA